MPKDILAKANKNPTRSDRNKGFIKKMRFKIKTDAKIAAYKDNLSKQEGSKKKGKVKIIEKIRLKSKFEKFLFRNV